MIDVATYLIDAGLSETEACKIASKMTSWDDLRSWLDAHYPAISPPPIDRTTIGAPHLEVRWRRNVAAMFKRMRAQHLPVGHEPDWIRLADRRRQTVTVTAILLTVILTYITVQILRINTIGTGWGSWLTANVYLILNTIMTYIMANGFCKLCLGSLHNMRGPQGNPHHPVHTAQDPAHDTRVAIVYPVYHEDVTAVSARMAAVWESLVSHSPEYAHLYDMHLISDSRKIEFRIAEQAAIYRLRQKYPQARFLYRCRTSNDNAKLGNVVDFCRRYGKSYRYMFMMDADSLVSGGVIHATLRMMEGNYRLGILQTNPTPILRTSLFGRMQQFASKLTGKMFSHAMQAMHMGHAAYIGHNAMIRMEPFINHCMLPSMSGKAPWGGKPLSHDIIEAAMMARAGYEVWFLPELEGSYEEIPANLLGFLQRERRWMQGNLQHLRLILTDGLTKIHRETFFQGIMSYVAAPMWALFLVISFISSIHFLKQGRIEVNEIANLEVPAVMLLAASFIFLFLPRMMAIAFFLKGDRARMFGGKDKMVLSVCLEALFFFFVSPIIMVFLTKFFWLWIKQRTISWGTQQRDDSPIPWMACIKDFGWVSLLGIALSFWLYHEIRTVPEQQLALLAMASHHRLTPDSILLWFAPLLFGITFSVIIVQFSSRTFSSLLTARLFCIPEEIDVPDIILVMKKNYEELSSELPDPENSEDTFYYASTSAFFHFHHRRHTKHRAHVAQRLCVKLDAGSALTLQEWSQLIQETECFDKLHLIANTVVTKES